MKSITIHGLDSTLDTLIREKAEKEGLSLNKTMKKLLRKALGITEQGEDNRQDYSEFLGQWSKQELREFNDKIQELNEVNSKDWQ